MLGNYSALGAVDGPDSTRSRARVLIACDIVTVLGRVCGDVTYHVTVLELVGGGPGGETPRLDVLLVSYMPLE